MILAEYITSEAVEMNITNKTKSTSESSYKPLTKERLVTLIKSKHEEIDGVEYDCMVKDYQLLKSSSGLFSIVIPAKQ